jgi:hypothetical protein
MTIGSISKINMGKGVNGNKPVKTETKENQPKDTYNSPKGAPVISEGNYKNDSIKINTKKSVDHEINTFKQGADYGNLRMNFYGSEGYSYDIEFGRTFSVIAPKTNSDVLPFIAQSGQIGFGLSQGGVGYKINAGVEVNKVSLSLTGQASAGVIPAGFTPYLDARGGVELRIQAGRAGGAFTINPNYGITFGGEETLKSLAVTVGYSIKQF